MRVAIYKQPKQQEMKAKVHADEVKADPGEDLLKFWGIFEESWVALTNTHFSIVRLITKPYYYASFLLNCKINYLKFNCRIVKHSTVQIILRLAILFSFLRMQCGFQVLRQSDLK